MNQYSHRYSVTASDIDAQYRITPTAFLMYFQDCFARYFSCLHIAQFDLIKENRILAITECELDTLPVETLWSEEVEVTVWISEFSPVRMYADFIFVKADTNEMMAKGSSCWCLINSETRGLERTDILSDRVGLLDKRMTESHRKRKFPVAGEIIREIRHQVNLLDLDFNGHVNNRSYLSIAMLTATDDFLLHNRMQHLSIHWQHETYSDDELRCTLKRVSDNEYVHTLVNKENKVAAEIYSVWQPIEVLADIAEVIERK